MWQSGATRLIDFQKVGRMFRGQEEATRTVDGDRSGVAKETVEEFGGGEEGLTQTRLGTRGYWDEYLMLMSGNLKGTMMPQTIEKKRQLLLSKTKQRRRERSALPMRLTSCIFKRPVTRITSHPGNEVRCRQREETWGQPQQVCAYRRLQGLQARSTEEELFSTLDVANTIDIIALRNAGGNPGRAGPGCLCNSPKPPLHGQQVTPGDIRRQTLKVKKARERLAVALRADRLAREAESQEPKRML
ncbi:methyl-CpG-binding domain protein 3-like 2B [Saccopteryx bilineata]|uniref:methyl-CpG-binding domain protein 3-like 2B n=1 Tax=Saccopteryx bilineata TaxID=59482 RepID=UPI00338E8BE4